MLSIEDKKWELILSSVKKEGKKIKKQRIVTAGALCSLLLFGITGGFVFHMKETNEKMMAEARIEVEAMLNHDIIYDDEFGIISAE